MSCLLLIKQFVKSFFGSLKFRHWFQSLWHQFQPLWHNLRLLWHSFQLFIFTVLFFSFYLFIILKEVVITQIILKFFIHLCEIFYTKCWQSLKTFFFISPADSPSEQALPVQATSEAINERLGGAEGGAGANEVSSSSSTSSSLPPPPVVPLEAEGATPADASSYNQDIVPDISKNNKYDIFFI